MLHYTTPGENLLRRRYTKNSTIYNFPAKAAVRQKTGPQCCSKISRSFVYINKTEIHVPMVDMYSTIGTQDFCMEDHY